MAKLQSLLEGETSRENDCCRLFKSLVDPSPHLDHCSFYPKPPPSSLGLNLLNVLGMRCGCHHWTGLPIHKFVYPNCSESHGPSDLICSGLDLKDILDVGCSNIRDMNVYACSCLFEAMRSNCQSPAPINQGSTNCTMNRAFCVNYSTVNTTTTCSSQD